MRARTIFERQRLSPRQLRTVAERVLGMLDFSRRADWLSAQMEQCTWLTKWTFAGATMRKCNKKSNGSGAYLLSEDARWKISGCRTSYRTV